ncbi:MAG: RimK family alpha-L-glutamate ligase [Patescibacteria group bacterium]|nr:RimK family alpha-L-glutamate ligase [Patescibacteria group bacterium]
MKILIAGLTKKPQFLRIKEEAEKKGHSVDGCLASELVILADKNNFKPMLSSGKKLEEYDLIYMIVGSRLWEWFTAALYLHKNYKTIIVNKKSIDPAYNYYQTPAIDYLKQTEAKINYPKSAILFSDRSVESIKKQFTFPLIVKASQGHRGEDVYLVKDEIELEKMVSLLTENVKSCVVREFIPNDGDIRVFCVGYKAVGAIKRTPKKGDFRSNVSQGGSVARFDLSKNKKVQEVAELAAKIMQTEIAGVDVMVHAKTGEPYVLEVNPGPQIEGIESTGINVAKAIVEYFEKLYYTSNVV